MNLSDGDKMTSQCYMCKSPTYLAHMVVREFGGWAWDNVEICVRCDCREKYCECERVEESIMKSKDREYGTEGIPVETPEEKEAWDRINSDGYKWNCYCHPVHDLCLDSQDKIISLCDTQRYGTQDLHKGVKAKEAANKPGILNYPWEGTNGDRERLMGKLINAFLQFQTGPQVVRALDELDNLVRLSPLLNDGTEDLKVNEVFEAGAKKHGFRTYLNYEVSDIEYLINALGRHILKGVTEKDEESGYKHIYHVLANIMMIRLILNKGE